MYFLQYFLQASFAKKKKKCSIKWYLSRKHTIDTGFIEHAVMVHRIALNVQDRYDGESIHEARHNSKEKTTGEKEAEYIEELDEECILNLHWYIIQFLWLIPRYCKEPIKTDSAWVNGYAGKHCTKVMLFLHSVFFYIYWISAVTATFTAWCSHFKSFSAAKTKTHSKSKVVMCETVFSHDLKLVIPKNHTGRQLLNK